MLRMHMIFVSVSVFRVTLYSVFKMFFFKQKTAYEMRISDWSSDVCSSDLHCYRVGEISLYSLMQRRKGTRLAVMQLCWRSGTRRILSEFIASRGLLWIATRPMQEDRPWQQSSDNSAKPTNKRCWRSEEHTSELQSLMRISYAVLCLKTKKNT